MADISKTVQIIFSADNQMSDAFRDVNNQIGTVDSSFGGLGGRAKDLAEDVLLVGAAALALATTFATFAAKEAAAFETAIQNISTILDETQGTQLPAIQAGILQLSEVLPHAAEDLAKAFYDIQSGIPLGEKGLTLLEVAAKAATAGLTSVQTAVSPFITILNSYKMGAEDAERVSDVLFQTVNHGVINFEQLAGGIGSVAALGAGLGQSIEQVGAAIVVLTKNTGQQEESFTRLVALYNQMAQTDTAQKLKAYGVEVLDVTGKMRPLDEIIGQMSAKQMTYQDIIKVFPEIRAAMGVNILVQDYKSLTTELDAMKNSQGATQAAFEKMIGTFDNQIKLLKNAWSNFLIVAGDPILEALKPIIKELGDEFKSTEGKVLGAEIGKAIAAWVTALSEFFANLQKIYSNLTGIKDASMAVDFAKWSGDIETIQFTLKAINSVVQGLLLPIALVHDGFVGTASFINTGLLSVIVLVEEALIKILQILDYIPGLDLSAPIESLKASSDEFKFAWQEATNALFGTGEKSQYWSDNVAKSIVVVDAAINRLGESGRTTSETITAGGENIAKAMDKQAAAAEKVTEATKEGVEGIKSFVEVTKDGTVVFNDNYKALEKTVKATDTKAEADKKATVELKKNVDAMIKLKLGLEEIQRKERVSIFEIQTKVDLAKIEASSKAFATMFKLVDTGITSTGDSITKLFGMLSGNIPLSAMWKIEDQIDKENKLRKGTFDLQKKLIDQQVAYMAMKAKAMSSGQALINISGDGMEPEIEAVMWKILKKIQVRANAEGVEYLLGI